MLEVFIGRLTVDQHDVVKIYHAELAKIRG
jgi:hypothetical protein